MKVQIQILSLWLFIGIGFLQSCKIEDITKKKIPEVLKPGGSAVQKSLVPVQIGAEKSKIVFSYQSKTLLRKIEYGDGSSSVLEYNNAGKPKLLLRYKGDDLVACTEYLQDKNGQLIKARLYKVIEGDYYDAGLYLLTYNASSQLSGISFYDLKNVIINTVNFSYSTNGNLVSDQHSVDGLRSQYLYDDKNGLFKNVQYSWLFAIEEENKLLFSAINNMKGCTFSMKPGLDQYFSYTYNTDGYPATISGTGKVPRAISKVTYSELK